MGKNIALRSLTSKVLRIVIPVVATFIIFGSSTASAITTASYVRNDRPGNDWVPVYYAPNARFSNVKTWLKDGSKFWMQCYVIQSTYPYTGNYTSTMWFWGLAADGNWGYVNSSWVFNQISVGRC